MLTEQRPRMVMEAAKCRGCQACQLICSFRSTRAFNPTKAHIVVRHVPDESRFALSFTSRCDRCGVCARYCLYGALQQEAAPASQASGGE